MNDNKLLKGVWIRQRRAISKTADVVLVVTVVSFRFDAFILAFRVLVKRNHGMCFLFLKYGTTRKSDVHGHHSSCIFAFQFGKGTGLPAHFRFVVL